MGKARASTRLPLPGKWISKTWGRSSYIYAHPDFWRAHDIIPDVDLDDMDSCPDQALAQWMSELFHTCKTWRIGFPNIHAFGYKRFADALESRQKGLEAQRQKENDGYIDPFADVYERESVMDIMVRSIKS